MTIRSGLLLLAALPLLGTGVHLVTSRSGDDDAAPSLSGIPPRPAGALGGTAFLEHLGQVPDSERQHAILREILQGNVPEFLRSLQPVRLAGQAPDGTTVRATVWVMPDYMAVGSDSDFVRVPLDLPTAATLAEELDLRLPTRKIVDAVYRQAAVQLHPIPMTPGPQMRSPGYVLTHNRRIEAQRAGMPLGWLTAGQKKDLVLSRRLRKHPGRVAIYGWHLSANHPIQPLSTVHGASYADYSHGVRFVSPTVVIDGVAHEYFDVLADGRLESVLSYEGGIENARALQDGAGQSGR